MGYERRGDDENQKRGKWQKFTHTVKRTKKKSAKASFVPFPDVYEYRPCCSAYTEATADGDSFQQMLFMLVLCQSGIGFLCWGRSRESRNLLVNEGNAAIYNICRWYWVTLVAFLGRRCKWKYWNFTSEKIKFFICCTNILSLIKHSSLLFESLSVPGSQIEWNEQRLVSVLW